MRVQVRYKLMSEHIKINPISYSYGFLYKHVDSAYRDIPFPLKELPAPEVKMEVDWTLTQFLGYLQSWSAVVYFEKEKRQNPLDLIHSEPHKLWGEQESLRHLSWPLTLRIGSFTQHSK